MAGKCRPSGDEGAEKHDVGDYRFASARRHCSPMLRSSGIGLVPSRTNCHPDGGRARCHHRMAKPPRPGQQSGSTLRYPMSASGQGSQGHRTGMPPMTRERHGDAMATFPGSASWRQSGMVDSNPAPSRVGQLAWRSREGPGSRPPTASRGFRFRPAIASCMLTSRYPLGPTVIRDAGEKLSARLSSRAAVRELDRVRVGYRRELFHCACNSWTLAR
jgi:hypothetical protein